VRLGTWNCQTGLDTHWDAAEALNPDVLTVQECGPSTKALVEQHTGWACEYQEGRWDRGLAVLARRAYCIEAREQSQPVCISTVIAGPRRFRFVGFWAMTPKHTGLTYPQQATRLIEQLPDDDLPTVLAGDFNASRSRRHRRNVDALKARGLDSAYHALNGVERMGDEPDPTSYFRWQRDRGYHMDFVFAPVGWRVDSVHVGTFDAYPGRGLSDHVPVVVSIGPESLIPEASPRP